MRWMTTAMILSLLLAGSNALQADGIQFADGSDEFRVVTADADYESDSKVVGAALECAAPEPACAAPAPCAPAPTCAPAPSCCAPAPAAPSCCAPAAPSCCAPAPTCCEQKSCCKSHGCCLTKMFHRKKQCNTCECDQCQQHAARPNFFSQVMELERRKNAWLVETFIDRF